jgi:membrane-associated phospholipid phosphatase
MISKKQWLGLAGLLLVFFMAAKGFSQSAEFRYLRGVNPRYPTNIYYKTFSSTAKPLSFAIPFGMLAVSLIKDDKKLETNAYETVAGLALTAIVTEALKVTIQRPRPYQTHNDIYPDEIDEGNAFPSGHTSLAFSMATSVCLVSRKWYYTVPAFTWAAGVAYSRIYLGQHYPSDVFAGALVGVAGAYASHWLHKKLFTSKKNKPSL